VDVSGSHNNGLFNKSSGLGLLTCQMAELHGGNKW